MPYGSAPGGPVAPVISLANTLAGSLHWHCGPIASGSQRHDLAIAFAAFQARNFAGVPAVDRDPESYIRQEEQDYAGQAEQGLPARATGSLNIGSLKGQ